MEGVTIRRMRVDDADGIANILNQIIEKGGMTVINGPLTSWGERAFLRRFSKKGIFYVALTPKLVGFQVLEPFAPYSKAFDHVATMGTYISLEERRKGIGAELSRRTLEDARKAGFEKIITYVLHSNTAALKFYKKLGFKAVGTAKRHAKLKGEYFDEIIIEKIL